MTLIHITITSTTDGNNALEEMKDPSQLKKKKSLKCSTWVTSQKQQNNLHFQGKLFNITVIQLYVSTTNAEKAEDEQFYKDLQDLLEDIFSS